MGAPPTLIDDLPSFERPPVVEVAVGLRFLQLPGLNTVALVRLVDDLWQDKYPHIAEQPALPPPTSMGTDDMSVFQWQTGTPPVRLWSLSKDESLLVQVQQDSLLLNWRKLRPNDPYPRYKAMRAEFAELWQRFSEYVEEHDFGALEPSSAEVSFFNRIAIDGTAEPRRIIKMMNPEWGLDRELAFASQVERDISTELLSGRQSIALAYRHNSDSMQLEISTRVAVDGGAEEVLDPLDEAHRIGVLTFDELTTDNAHATWGRTNARHS